MAGARHADVLEHLIGEVGQQVHIDVVGFEAIGVLPETLAFQALSNANFVGS